MNGYNFTERVRKVLAMAREEAARLHHEYVGTEHILLGLIREGGDAAPPWHRDAAWRHTVRDAGNSGHAADADGQGREEVEDSRARSLLQRPDPARRRQPA